MFQLKLESVLPHCCFWHELEADVEDIDAKKKKKRIGLGEAEIYVYGFVVCEVHSNCGSACANCKNRWANRISNHQHLELNVIPNITGSGQLPVVCCIMMLLKGF